MSPRVGMPSPSDVMFGTTSSSFSSCVSLEEVGARVERIGRWMVAAAVRRGESAQCVKLWLGNCTQYYTYLLNLLTSIIRLACAQTVTVDQL